MGAALPGERAFSSSPRQPRRAGDGVDRAGRRAGRGWGAFQTARDRRRKADNLREADIHKPIRCPTGRETLPSQKVFLQEGGKPLDPCPRMGRREIPRVEGMGASATTVFRRRWFPDPIHTESHVPVPTSGSPVCRRSPSDSSRAVSREALHVLLLLADLRSESLHTAPSPDNASARPAVAAARCLPATRAT